MKSNRMILMVCKPDTTNESLGFNDDSDGTNDTQDDYEYDDQGNMVRDYNKGIVKIIYNHLNLPVSIDFAEIGQTISYFYNANGIKLKKVVNTGAPLYQETTTDYLGGFQYENTFLQFFPHLEGYVKHTPDKHGNPTYDYVYNYTDHLGNIRLSYTLDPQTNVLKILEENHYYPFGLKHTNYSSDRKNIIEENETEPKRVGPEGDDEFYKYKYNGKEWQDELGLNFYDYGARNYDPAIGRWMNIDPLAENSRRWTPYNYAYNNPIYFIDPDGMQAIAGDDIIVTAKDGTELFTLDDGKKAVTKMTAQELYSKGTQWFEPLADNYMPLKSVAKGSASDKLKHFSSAEVLEFANEDRWMISYQQGWGGDWKASEKGADGYLMVTVDGMPYWADAIGQIPFAVDKVTDEIADGHTRADAVQTTVDVGKEYGEGKLVGGKADNSNTYDNYFILRGALNGANGRDITKPITTKEAETYGL